ncbi:MAG: imidazole glycerol phosphate synthase subunit HisF [Candidatus Omnitrophica bacterium]|nr:imidazole glycerol phosphate synthase subunit HisF [Candidatus Omnitrophota bacterium]
MLKNRLIPILLLRNGRCVKGRRFGEYRDTGHPVTAARIYDAQRVDELVFLDIMASLEKRDVLLNIVAETAEECFMPLTVGGGIRNLEDIKVTLAAGADKVVINSAAVERPGLINEAARVFGNSTIVVGIDYRQDGKGGREVHTHGGTKPAGLEPSDWAEQVAARGAGEIILTSIDREGMMEGYDLALIRQVSEAVDIPVIAHGGAGTLKDLRDGIEEGKASAVAAASIFHFTDQSPIKARLYLKDNSVNVRI